MAWSRPQTVRLMYPHVCKNIHTWVFKSHLLCLWGIPQEPLRSWWKCRTGQHSGESSGGLESGAMPMEALWLIDFVGAYWALILCLGHCQILAKLVGVKEITEGCVLHNQIEEGQSCSHHFCERVTKQKWQKSVKGFTVDGIQGEKLQEGPGPGLGLVILPIFYSSDLYPVFGTDTW